MTSSQNQTSDRIEHSVPAISEPIGHFSTAVSYGGLLYVSGLVSTDERGNIVGGNDITAQAQQVYKNIKIVLKQVGLDYGDLLKITTFLTSIDDREKVNQVRRSAFGPTKPASTLIGIRELAHPDLKIEVEAIAALRE